MTKSKRFLESFSIIGIPPVLFAAIAAVVLIASFITIGPNHKTLMPGGLIGAFAASIVIGGILATIGEETPILNNYMGGGAFAVLFGSSALVYFNLMPAPTAALMKGFIKGGGFLNFYIAALIAGSILGMNKKLLIAASARYLPTIFGGVVVSLLFCGAAGALLGFGWKEAILYIALPITGGGMGAGAIPMSQMYAQATGSDAAHYLSVMVPALILGNTVAIVAGGLMDRLGKWKPSLSGEGRLMRSVNDETADHMKDSAAAELSLASLGSGLLLSVTFFIVGIFINKLVPQIHTFAWMIIVVGLTKVSGLLPVKFEQACKQWHQFVAGHLTWALLACVGVAYINMADIINALTPQYLFLVVITVLGSIVGSAVTGHMMGFFPIEASITAGLCMANSGGTGDVAVLSASRRMDLMPFAAISSRIGGALILLLGGALASLLL